MSRSFEELIDDLKLFRNDPKIALARKAIIDLLQMHKQDQQEIVRLRRWIEALEEEKECTTKI